MSDDIIRRIMSDMEHDSERDDTVRRMIASAFEARTRTYTFATISIAVVALALAVWVAVLFFKTDDIRWMIAYGTLFNTCMLTIVFVRLVLWQLLLRQGIIREIKRLELRVLEMTKASANTPANRLEERVAQT
jgi:ABC-type sugar transport system permease subunit